MTRGVRARASRALRSGGSAIRAGLRYEATLDLWAERILFAATLQLIFAP